jgi:hypothetical protein
VLWLHTYGLDVKLEHFLHVGGDLSEQHVGPVVSTHVSDNNGPHRTRGEDVLPWHVSLANTITRLRLMLRFLVYRVQRTICGHSWTTNNNTGFTMEGKWARFGGSILVQIRGVDKHRIFTR